MECATFDSQSLGQGCDMTPFEEFGLRQHIERVIEATKQDPDLDKAQRLDATARFHFALAQLDVMERGRWEIWLYDESEFSGPDSRSCRGLDSLVKLIAAISDADHRTALLRHLRNLSIRDKLFSELVGDPFLEYSDLAFPREVADIVEPLLRLRAYLIYIQTSCFRGEIWGLHELSSAALAGFDQLLAAQMPPSPFLGAVLALTDQISVEACHAIFDLVEAAVHRQN